MWTKKFAVLLWMILFAALRPCFSQSSPTRQQQIESHARQAAEDLKQNKPDLAVPEFRAIVGLDPSNVDARGNLGVLLFFQGSYSEAIPELRAALKMRSTLWKIQALLGIAEKRTGDVSAGMELIEIYSKTGDLDKAAETVNTLRKLEPTNEAVLYTAYRVYSDLTADSLLSLSVVAPNSARMHQALAHELAKRGETEKAIENYRAALKLDPQLPGIHFELAEMLSTLTTPESLAEAESEYKAALQANPSDEQSECRLGEIALRRSDTKEAYNRYAKAVQLQPGDPDANIGLAKVLMSMGQPQKAQPLLEHALQLDPTSAVAHFRLSAVYRETGRPDEAKHELEEYQKYKGMKEKLQEIYRQMRPEQIEDESKSTAPQN
jgi:predicted Zn-dependent protease